MMLYYNSLYNILKIISIDINILSFQRHLSPTYLNFEKRFLVIGLIDLIEKFYIPFCSNIPRLFQMHRGNF